ncbi:hypothetical protein [Afipia sp. DC4300-2b1]|uniref:amino acid kinase family protein n=1 Tax=Afipia sp. DC4300-2b1 TaxID=2804672 RepID=UPI003CF81169
MPSPKPKHVCDISLVDALVKRGTIVIAGGRGGMPVIRDAKGVRTGVPAVIDKDLTSAHIANVLDIDELLILTAVPRVAINFGKPNQKELTEVRSTRSRPITGRDIFRRAAWLRKSMRQSAFWKAAASAPSSVTLITRCLRFAARPERISFGTHKRFRTHKRKSFADWKKGIVAHSGMGSLILRSPIHATA